MSSSWTPTGVVGSLRQGDQPDGPPLADMPIGNDFDPCPERPIGSLRQGGRTNLDTSFTNGRGAGRTYEHILPPNMMLIQGNGSLLDGISRQGFQSQMTITQGQSPGGETLVYYKGRVAFHGTAVTGITGHFGPVFTFPTRKGGAKHKGDLTNWRVKAILAFEPAGSGDLGLGISLDDSVVHGSLLTGVAAGMILRPDAANKVTFYSRPAEAAGGAFAISDVCPITLDVADWHCYEYRFIGATDTDDAVLKVLIDNQVQFQYSFGDNLLPEGGMNVMLRSQSGGAYYLPVGSLLTAGAWDEASLL